VNGVFAPTVAYAMLLVIKNKMAPDKESLLDNVIMTLDDAS